MDFGSVTSVAAAHSALFSFLESQAGLHSQWAEYLDQPKVAVFFAATVEGALPMPPPPPPPPPLPPPPPPPPPSPSGSVTEPQVEDFEQFAAARASEITQALMPALERQFEAKEGAHALGFDEVSQLELAERVPGTVSHL
jgi:hypothetical protein